jgi:hypothetical protein
MAVVEVGQRCAVSFRDASDKQGIHGGVRRAIAVQFVGFLDYDCDHTVVTLPSPRIVMVRLRA